ncbi:uncharacterized protein LOC143500474 [Brachyhypopomus gauderio]|uniref:uncharacterized protein LOC143500474 n=1 Tax=Brachyhypopomus gauderio TaxID=698409 RepID=UPI0040422935
MGNGMLGLMGNGVRTQRTWRRRLGFASLLMCFGVLISAIEKGDSFPQDADQSCGVATVTLETPNVTTATVKNYKQCVLPSPSRYRRKIPRSCVVCKVIVMGLMKFVEGRFRRRSVALCKKLRREFRRRCLVKADKYKAAVMHKLFAGSAKATCQKYNICKKK